MKEGSNRWVVIRFGGSSISSTHCWSNLAQAVREHREEGKNVLVVQSALAGITDILSGLLNETYAEARQASLTVIEMRHSKLARDLDVTVGVELSHLYAALGREIDKLWLPGNIPPQVRARILATGELMACKIGKAFLSREGLPFRLLDARHLLIAEPRPDQPLKSQYLSAACDAAPDNVFSRSLSAKGSLIITQGSIASNQAGETVLLGRGSSGISAVYLAAKLGAECLEIWTDAPGLFSADPREVPEARLLRLLDYDEAQEISTAGTKILHPRCIEPARAAAIPMQIRCARDPSLPGTLISSQIGDNRGRVKAISVRRGIKLITMQTLGMWQQSGFLADVFARFKHHGVSVDLVSTSETSITVSLDSGLNPPMGSTLHDLLQDLNRLCQAQLLECCAAITVVGREMRANLHRLAPALELFRQRRIHLLSQAANDLNFTFVVDQADAARLVRELHALLVQHAEGDHVLGPTLAELVATEPQAPKTCAWWIGKREQLLALAADATPLYVYDLDSVQATASALSALNNVDRLLFAVKANHHPDILRVLRRVGLGFECVSPGELAHVRALFPDMAPEQLLFTPNFAPREDYAAGFDAGARVTLDSLYPLRAWPALFKQREIFLRLDPGHGAGHHQHVRTGGEHAKFGIPLSELDEARRLTAAVGAKVTGLHAHVGSGILDPDSWHSVGLMLAQCMDRFSDVRHLDLGGGLGVAEKPGEVELDLARLDAVLEAVKQARPECEIWLEPGRYLVSAAGVLLARVTQSKGKGEVRYLGVDAGMNSLIRPALYGAWHRIVNLTRLNDPPDQLFTVVGPLCETGDILGHERLMPASHEGDVMLIANAGAYGRVMSSNYNLREPAVEMVL